MKIKVSSAPLLAIGMLVSAQSTAIAQMSANPPEVGSKIRSLGTELTPELFRGTMQTYAPLRSPAEAEGVTVKKDIKYGEHERNVLDVYAPQTPPARKPPVMVFLHGGGFVRGDKADVANIANYFAKRGVVTVAMSYRFAPKSTWPSGPEDIASVIRWIKRNPDVHGGNPREIFLAGNSAGSMHVAGYLFFKDYQVANDDVRGGILVSLPSINLTDHPLDPARDALYFGPDQSKYAGFSVINHINERKLPLFVALGELDMPLVVSQTRQFIDALYARDQTLPILKTAIGHNHISIVEHIGTADQSMGPDILEFIATNRAP
jgi:acetyl esterase